MNKHKVTSSITKQFSGNIRITAEISSIEEGFYWRLSCGLTKGKWTSHYAGVYTFKYQGRLFGYCTDYWDESLPVNVPFEIIQGD